MALTLVEAAKIALNEGKVFESAIIKQFASSSGILENIPFVDIAGNAYSYNREETLPGIGFRGVNEAYPESVGVLNPVTETLSILGGDLDVDKFVIDTMGVGVRSQHEMMKVRALALAWTQTFIQGDTATNPKSYDGLRKRLTGTQLISNGSTSGGDVLSLTNLDQAIDEVTNPTHIIMNKTMRRILTTAARNVNVGGYITYDLDGFGRRIAFYNELPIIVLDQDGSKSQILPFTETGAGGGTAQSASIYVVSFDTMGVHGLQNGGMQVRDLGELNTQPVFRTRVEHYQSIAVKDGQGASRLYGIKNGAAVD
jgi:hypothetical protein